MCVAAAACVAASLIGPACNTRNERVVPTKVVADWPMPDPDRGGSCADVGDLRVCWDGSPGSHPISVLPRRSPPARLSPLGFLCSGSGKEARCIDRAREAPPFRCEGGICRQRNPRLPDDGEWECADFASIVVCHGGARPAGVPPGATAPGYFCGPRRGVPGERVCVDLSPDMPEGVARGYRCRFEAAGGLMRVCEQDPTTHAVADPCDSTHPCAPELACDQGRCLPLFPSPTCWLPRDCDNPPCRLGTCQGAP